METKQGIALGSETKTIFPCMKPRRIIKKLHLSTYRSEAEMGLGPRTMRVSSSCLLTSALQGFDIAQAPQSTDLEEGDVSASGGLG